MTTISTPALDAFRRRPLAPTSRSVVARRGPAAAQAMCYTTASSAVGVWRSLVSALVWGTRGRQFKSGHADHFLAAKRLLPVAHMTALDPRLPHSHDARLSRTTGRRPSEKAAQRGRRLSSVESPWRRRSRGGSGCSGRLGGASLLVLQRLAVGRAARTIQGGSVLQARFPLVARCRWLPLHLEPASAMAPTAELRRRHGRVAPRRNPGGVRIDDGPGRGGRAGIRRRQTRALTGVASNALVLPVFRVRLSPEQPAQAVHGADVSRRTRRTGPFDFLPAIKQQPIGRHAVSRTATATACGQTRPPGPPSSPLPHAVRPASRTESRCCEGARPPTASAPTTRRCWSRATASPRVRCRPACGR